MAVKTKSQLKKGVQADKPRALFGISTKWKNMIDDYSAELGPSSKIRHIKFVNPVKLVLMCERDIEKIDQEIASASHDLDTANDDRKLLGQHYDITVNAYNDSCKKNGNIEAKLVEIQAFIHAREIEKQGAIKSLEEFTRRQKISERALARFMDTGAKKEPDKPNEMISSLQTMRNEKQDAIKHLNEQKREISQQLAKERKVEEKLGALVNELGDAIEANIDLIAGLTRELTDLNSRRSDRDKDLSIIFKKSGIGDVKGLVADLEHEVEEVNKKLAKAQEDYRTQAKNASNVARDFHDKLVEANTALAAKNQLFQTAQRLLNERTERIKQIEYTLSLAKQEGAKAGANAREMARLAEELHAQESINKVLREQLDKGRKDLADLQGKPGTAREDVLSKQLENLGTQFDKLMEDMTTEASKNAELTADLEAAGRQIEQMNQAVAGIEQLNLNIASLNETLKFKEGVIQDGVDRIEEKDREIGQLNEQLVEMDTKVNTLSAENSKLRNELNDETRHGSEAHPDETVRADSPIAVVRELGETKEDLQKSRLAHNTLTRDMNSLLSTLSQWASAFEERLPPDAQGLVLQFRGLIKDAENRINPPKPESEPIEAAAPETRALRVTRKAAPIQPESDFNEGAAPETFSSHDTRH